MIFAFKFQTLKMILSSLHKYKRLCPTWTKCCSILNISSGITPDHIAWRTFKYTGGIDSIEKIITSRLEYTPIKQYEFENINVRSKHFE